MSLPEEFIPPSIEEIAALLPAYDIKSFIAKGGMGAVYMASQRSLDRMVAIKILPRKFGEDQTFRESFEQEAKSMAKFNHPNLVSIYDFGQIDGMLYFIMEMVQGKPLYYSCYGKKIAPEESNRLIVEVCDGLQHAHKHGILHRDIKPANILLDPNVSPKIGDFGLARGVKDHASDQAFGTPGYTAPEVVNNPTAVRECTDIYSVGVMLYELLTSKIPETPYVPVTSIIRCSPKYDQVILKAINENPDARYQSASEMREELLSIDKLGKASSPGKSLKLTKTAAPTTKFAVSSSSPAASRRLPTPSSAASFAPPANNTTTRNLIIIVVLIGAIIAAWQGLQVIEANREIENASVEARKQKDAEDKKLSRLAQPNLGEDETKPPKPKNLGSTNKHSPIVIPKKSLEDLQSRLKKGLRLEMPEGTISKNGKSRLYIEKELSWHGANNFAQKYGAHLPVLASAVDLNSFSSTIQADEPLWVGAGSSGDNKWQWVDGTQWNHQVRSSSKLSFLTVNKFGILSPASPIKKHSFYIEWFDDGSSPARLANQLKRTFDSLDTARPQYPAGTVSYDGKHYLLVLNRKTWHEAAKLAATSGGHLAVPSSQQENAWMVKFVSSNIGLKGRCWIGGLCENGKDWKWHTGEPWTFATWKAGKLDAENSNTYGCAINAGKTWEDFEASEALPFHLIEWSDDSKAVTNEVTTAGASDEVIALKLKCRKILEKTISKNEIEFTRNCKGLELDFVAFQSRLTKDLQQANQPAITAIIQSTKNNRISSRIKGRVSEKMSDVHQNRLQRQNIIEAKQFEEVEKIRLHYIEKLEGIVKSYEEKGQRSHAQNARDEIKSSNRNKRQFADYILK